MAYAVTTFNSFLISRHWQVLPYQCLPKFSFQNPLYIVLIYALMLFEVLLFLSVYLRFSVALNLTYSLIYRHP